jgi:ribosomal protein L37AE/L43A
MNDELKQLTVQTWKDHVKHLEAKGVRIVVCPKCTEVYQGKYLTEVICCAKCGYRKHGR